ncbi:MAG TPA: primosomal protein N' [Candidatus Limnocylindrales bacterium]
MTLELALDPVGGPDRLVEIAIDAAGPAGSRSYTYALPAALADIQAGEAVLVEFGRRRALGIVLGDATVARDGGTKPVLDRIRSDGPLLPELTLALVQEVASHYLAPPSMVVRSALPPAMLERLELVAEGRPDRGAAGDLAAIDADLVDQLADGPAPVRSLATPEGRAGLLRRLRSLEERGLVALDWTLTAAGAGPRFERWLTLTGPGRTTADGMASGDRPRGRPLGPRQVAALEELRLGPRTGLSAAHLGGRHGTSALAGLARRGLVSVEVRERPRRPLGSRRPGRRGGRPTGSVLTPPQVEAIATIRGALGAGDPTPVLLDGITGGGKTAVYVEAIGLALELGRRSLLLVPEIALALPLVDRLRADLDARVALVHSGLADGERADEWRRIRAGEAEIVVGTRLAIMAPLPDVGLVIVDEEHDPAYKSDRTPRLQARDVAVRLARLAGAALVLGSATPSVESEWRARTGAIRRVRLPSRPIGAAPVVDVVDLREELQTGNRGLLSAALRGAIASLATANGEQAILVMNRRGTASVVVCRDCGHVQGCPDCDRPLVYHHAGTSLRCHHCGRGWPAAVRCPVCGSPRIRYLGGGTERLERELREAFPALRVDRLDRDVAEKRGAASRVIDAFSDGRVDVLVGTSLVTKALDVPGVTLVGIVSADVALNLPDERAAERTYQLIAQAVGRAGRGELQGHAIIQTYQPQHPAIRAVATGDATAFYDTELAMRERFGSPPFGSVVKLTLSMADRAAAEREAAIVADRLRERAAGQDPGVTVTGPAPAYIARRGERWRWNVILRGRDPAAMVADGLGTSWAIDVDPESLL